MTQAWEALGCSFNIIYNQARGFHFDQDQLQDSRIGTPAAEAEEAEEAVSTEPEDSNSESETDKSPA